MHFLRCQLPLCKIDLHKKDSAYNWRYFLLWYHDAMKKWDLIFRVVDRNNFLELKDGLKVVETRAATPKYREVKKGDILVITCGAQRIQKEVKRVRIFTSVGAMVKSIPYRRIMPSAKSIAEVRETYHSYPGYDEKLRKYGVIAFDI